MTIESDIQKLSPGALIELFSLDATALGGSLLRFHSGVNELGNDVVWAGNTYTRFPIDASGFDRNSSGSLPRPKVRVSDITGTIGALTLLYDDLVGAKITRSRTLVKYLDAVNFSGGVNPTADPTAAFADEVWFVDRKSAHLPGQFVEWELAAAFDVAGVMLPRRQVIQNICPWVYRSAECSYAGGAVAKADDIATADLAQDACSHKISGCKLRFGSFATLPFGGFPAAGLLR